MHNPIILLLLSFTISITAQATNCTRDFLQAAASNYVTAQTSGSVSSFTYLSSTTSYTENDKTADIKASILSVPQKIDHARSAYDTTQCATYTELIIADPKAAHVIGTQIHYSTTDSKVSKMQTIVTSTGDWLFNATGTLYYASHETPWDIIPSSSRDSRDVIKAAADAYLDLFKDKTVKVPWGSPCARLEGGSYTGHIPAQQSDSCNVGVPSGLDLTNRRYVIDEETGEVDVFLNFGGTTGLTDSHEFRIEGGKIRFVHTITVDK